MKICVKVILVKLVIWCWINSKKAPVAEIFWRVTQAIELFRIDGLVSSEFDQTVVESLNLQKTFHSSNVGT